MTLPARLPIPPAVTSIAQRLEASGYETWCVGGAVRDNLLGEPNHDFDLATAAPPDVVRKLFRRTVPIGIEHGTVAVLDDEGTPHEVTTFRKDVRTDGRHAVVEFGVSLEEDLARRDFTINTIAHHPLRGDWRDPFDGRRDLDAKLVRAVGRPEERFREDYLRIVRALRFAARFGFTIDAATWDAAVGAADGLRHLSAERVRDEWFKGLASARRVSELVDLWRRVGALALWLPEIAVRGGEEVDRFEARDPVLLTAYLSSDPRATLARLRCSNAEIDRGTRIAAHRNAWPDPKDERAVRRWLAAVGPAAADLLAVAVADAAAAGLADAVARVRASGAPLTIGDLAVNGADLLAAGVPAGPALGQVLRALLEDVLDDPAANTRAALVSRIPRHVAGGTPR